MFGQEKQVIKKKSKSIRQWLGDLRKSLRYHLALPLELMPDAPVFFTIYRQMLRLPDVKRQPGGWLYQGEFYPDYLFMGGASCAVHFTALEYCNGTGVDFGAGFWPLPGSIPVDREHGPGLENNLEQMRDQSLDYIFSSHCLEHIEQWREALAFWKSKLKFGGVLFLYLPHPECKIWLPGSPFVGDGHKWTPTLSIIRDAYKSLDLKIIDQDDGPDMMQSFRVVGRRRS